MYVSGSFLFVFIETLVAEKRKKKNTFQNTKLHGETLLSRKHGTVTRVNTTTVVSELSF